VSETYSVVIPAYNAERTIEACLASVTAQIFAPLEVLVVDDNSGDGTEAAVRRCEGQLAAAGIRLEYCRLSRNAGPSAARNKAISVAKGSYIAFLDADDTWASEKLAIVDRFVGGSGAGLVCHAYAMGPVLRSGGSYESERVSMCGMLIRNPAQTSCTVVRKQPALAFDETMRHCEDYDLWMRIGEHHTILRIVGDPLTRLGRPQLSAGGLSGATMQMRLGEVRVYFNFCRRAWLSRAWLFPGLLIWSAVKHIYSWLRR
jgi:glycosyltransferase involved in cell wall biosynthesis